ncbi:Protein of unknown function DUF3468 [Penicillium chermesinum]|uniref:Zn(2)-C6 fungal-type domain-containing protein n=1 Tax=Penicillium chermesinum TaxID=63820 RepID=A0A9W9NNZ5_9EURO|nr:Protein of unknown function DUF3468 [Penicillium chermesinum]KAJ5223395.1 Protein of unknown function DUF3468 [Penicillium chermesinum]
MEIRADGASTSVTSESSQSPESHPPRNATKKRVRRWHHRGFTGCSTCRRRHVRCDEASPVCHNCTRLSLECDGTQGRMTFKAYGPQGQEPPKATKKRTKNSSRADDALPGTATFVLPTGNAKHDGFENLVVSPTTLGHQAPKFRFADPASSIDLMHAAIESSDEIYYTHFIDQVSTLLIIYDNSINANPYRSYFPEFARSSPSMVGAMQALGALHRANTSTGPERNKHFQQAMGKYGEVVQLFRSRYARPSQQLGMTDFATCLLLCLFEMMDSQNQNWAVHLQGAREIYNLLFYPHTGTNPTREIQRVAESNHPLRSFLVSLLSYLDVAGACASPAEQSSRAPTGRLWEEVELRQAWSGMMEVQAQISVFGRDKSWMSPEVQDAVYKDIFNQLVVWRASTPISLRLLGDMELDDESLRLFPFPDVLEYVGCIEAYEKATFVHLHQVGGAGRPGWVTDRTYLDMLLTRILTLIRKLSKGVGQLACLWPLFIAGQETRNESEQDYVRQTMQDLRRFGFKNVDKGLEHLERVWFKRRAFPRRMDGDSG